MKLRPGFELVTSRSKMQCLDYSDARQSQGMETDLGTGGRRECAVGVGGGRGRRRRRGGGGVAEVRSGGGKL